MDSSINLWLPPKAAEPQNVKKLTSFVYTASQGECPLAQPITVQRLRAVSRGDGANEDLLGFKANGSVVEDEGLK